MTQPKPPPWKRPLPKARKAPVSLTTAQKNAARDRANAAGRRYPNLVDNMWATKQPKT
ncbi:MAG: hypothetical protein ABIR62_04635 [Dokdonella sp.]|uniref:hypothetical protein n=1 Tax=Dokdonella sp. TaxID=2291710 RepID=UPI0032673162